MKIDVLSKYLLHLINVILRFVLVPIYIRHIGLAGYGLIGFYGSLFAAMVFFDFGMGLASNKILAEDGEFVSENTRRILKSVEVIYLSCTLLLGLIIIVYANPIATAWLTINDPSLDGTHVVRMMGMLFVVDWPKSLYTGFLVGQKKMRMASLISGTCLILQSVLLLLVLSKYHGTINSFFYVAILIGLFETVFLRYYGTRMLPQTSSYARISELRKFYYYCSGVTIFSGLSLVMFQFDKLYISHWLPISDLGTYSVAGIIPFAMLTFIYPITSAIFPRIVNIRESCNARRAFIGWSTVVFLVSGSMFTVVIFNINQINWLWLKDSDQNLCMLSTYLLIGVYLYSATTMIVNVLLANEKSLSVSTMYFCSIVVYLINIFSYSTLTLENLSKAWIVLNICLFVSALVALFKFDQSLCVQYLKRYIIVMIAIVAYIIAIKLLEYQGVYMESHYYRLYSYMLLLSINIAIFVAYLHRTNSI